MIWAFLNASRMMVSYATNKTGLLAADAAFDAVQAGRQSDELGAEPSVGTFTGIGRPAVNISRSDE
jgi:hypothetical protein